MTYLADPGGQFASDVHRRVLAHLSPPNDTIGWSEPALFSRMVPDVGTNLQSIEELQQVLDELEKDGLATRHEGDIWQMSDQGFALLTGPVANEPSTEASANIQPAQIGAATSLNGSTSQPVENQ